MTDITTRNAILREILRDRRRELHNDVQNRIHGGRIDRPTDVRDDLEAADADIQGDIDIALLQMRAETLTRINEALFLLDAGQYGSCVECEGEISERRLRALPFAVRCQACQEARETKQRDERQLDQRRGHVSLFSAPCDPPPSQSPVLAATAASPVDLLPRDTSREGLLSVLNRATRRSATSC
jgi:DnaK suppressor protein